MQTKTCTKCNQTKPLTDFYFRSDNNTYRNDCKLCNNAGRKARAQIEGKESIAAKNKIYRQKNREKVLVQKIQHYHENKELINAKRRHHRKENIEKCREQDRINHLKHSANRKKNAKKWREKNPNWINLYRQTPKGKAVYMAATQKRRALIRQVGGSFTADQVLQLFDKQKGICIYCKTKLFKNKKNGYHVDHIYPISKGGMNVIENAQLLCPSCNCSKSNKLPEEFAQQFNMMI